MGSQATGIYNTLMLDTKRLIIPSGKTGDTIYLLYITVVIAAQIAMKEVTYT